MIRKAETLAMTVLMVVLYKNLALGQATPPTILAVELENYLSYREDTSDLSKFATDPNATTSTPSRNFNFTVQIGDKIGRAHV